MENDGPTFDIANIIVALRRRIWLMAAITVLGAAGSVAAALSMPPVFRAGAKVLVESQQIPDNLAQSTITAGAAERLRVIEQKLMTRENLLDVANRLQLFGGADGMSPTDKARILRFSTQIHPINVDGGGRRGLAAFTISVDWGEPEIAAQVANEFVTLVIEQNLEARNERATDTLRFFSNEADRLRSEISSLEAQITAFKIENQDALPDSLVNRRDELNTIQERLFAMEQNEILLQQRAEEMQRTIDSETARAGSDETDPEVGQLLRIRRELAQQRAIYSEEHPAIRRLIAQEEQLARLVRASAGGADGPELSTVAARARSQIASIEQQMIRLDEQRTALIDRQSELEASIGETPKVETELRRLNRRLAELQERLQAAGFKENQAQLGRQLEASRRAERFEIIEQAVVPEHPIAPKRKLIAAGGVAGSLGLALGLGLLLELTSKVIYTRSDLNRLSGIRPIAAVPVIKTKPKGRSAARSGPKRTVRGA